MRGLPPQTLPLRVVIQGDHGLLEDLSQASHELLLNPVETNLEISGRVTRADVLVVDVTRNPAVALEEIRNLQLDRPVLALVHRGGELDAIAAGAKGAIPRTSAPEAIVAAIGALHHGLAVVEPSLVRSLNAPAPVHAPRPVGQAVLTNRENEVLALMADGLSNKEIAARLEISEHTAKFHVNSILQKMGAQKRVEAVVRAAKQGIIEL